MRTQALPPRTVVRRRTTDAWVAPAGLLLLALAVLAAGLLYLRQASVVATGGYDLLRLEAERTHLEIRNRQLAYKVAELSSLVRVETEALETLGMRPPEQTVYLRAKAR